MWRRIQDDRGSTTLELLIVFPVFLAILLSAVQVAMYWHARDLCSAAAQNGLQAARVSTGTAGAAERSARSFLTHTGSGAVNDPRVTVTSTGTAIRVEVRATAMRVFPIPGLDMTVTQVVEGPREVFTTPGDRGSP